MGDTVEITTPNDNSFKISNLNPYTKPHCNHNNNTLLSRNRIFLSHKLATNAVRIENMKNTVICISIFDILVGIPYYFLNLYVGIISNICSLFGLCSVYNLKQNHILIYDCYQFIQIFLRMGNIIMFPLYDHKHNNPFEFIKDNIALNVTILIILQICQIYISFIISTFYSYFPSKKELETILIESYV